MGTVIRADLSRKNKWWIPKHRYYELKHFCMQYPDWKRERQALNAYGSTSTELILSENGGFGRPTESVADRMTYFGKRIEMVERAAKLTDDCIGDYVLQAVIQGISYDILYTRRPIPCCREIYYELYRKFFYILNGLRE